MATVCYGAVCCELDSSGDCAAQSLYQMNAPPRKLLVLNLDKTLVHATATELEHAADFMALATCCPSLLTYLGGDLAPWRVTRT